ncbi:hypothetical protein L210DRAFT_3616305 [Boletus edulis BED1]|uniref:T6SS Phospholipase effector Tle1-like catalytic domain-containing protein n=1 Tax=Boletus edulis BED1 TaxID=1328754 RepID=A0AAD4G5C6_BOLED|nr:hypothetical protein L210DRAFT_3616305 [Boletus edulis BED1]
MPEAIRNLVVCIDGTSNNFGRRNTNIVKLYRQIGLDAEAGCDKPQQRAYYSSGIGTHAKNLPLLHRVEKVISDWFDMALAWNVEENVKDAYGWIYLFGFSRGAYQVRVLASLIHEVGLIRTPTEKQIEIEIATEFKKTYCWWGVRIHFVGVWDTVSSVGLIKGDVFVSTSASVANASHFRHALALDERRVKFMPEYFQEMNAHRNNMLRLGADGDIKEVWFAGCHADVSVKYQSTITHNHDVI